MPVLRELARALTGHERRDSLYGWQTVPDSLFGGVPSIAGPSVNEHTALRIVAVYRALSLLSGTLASLPLRAYRMTDNTPELVASPLLDFPGGRDPITGIPHAGSLTAFSLWERALAAMWGWGNAYLIKVPSVVRDQVVRLDHIDPWRVSPRAVKRSAANPAGKLFGVRDDRGIELLAGPADILHIPGFGYDPLMGISPIGCARQALGLAVAAEEYGARLFGSGSLMGGILQTDQDLEEPEAEALKARWNAKIAGLAHGHEIAVLDRGAKFQPVSIPPIDSQFIESRKFGVTEIARLYGIPPHLLGDVEVQSSWGTGLEQQNLGWVAYTLRAPATRVEQAVSNELLPRGQLGRYDFSELLRGDTAARFDGYAKGIEGSFLTVNEARKAEGLPPVGGGDKLLMKTGLGPFSTDKQPPPPALAPPPPPATGEPPAPPAAA